MRVTRRSSPQFARVSERAVTQMLVGSLRGEVFPSIQANNWVAHGCGGNHHGRLCTLVFFNMRRVLGRLYQK
jgi:hypothetical protein